MSLVASFAAFARSRIFDEAIDVSAFVVFRQIFRDRVAVGSDEEEAVAILPFLHLITGADPAPAMLAEFGFLVGIKVARAQRSADVFDVGGEAEDDRLGHFRLRMGRRA